MRTIDIADIETFLRTGLPRATDEEVASRVARLGGRGLRLCDPRTGRRGEQRRDHHSHV